MKSHLSITQSGITALFTTIVGQVVAFVPAFSSDKQILISAGSAVISAAFLAANAIHKLADSNVSLQDLEQGVRGYVSDELGKINLTKLAQDAINTQSIPALEHQVETAVSNEWQRILSGLQAQPAAPAPAVQPAQAPAAAAPPVVPPAPPQAT